MPYTLEIIGFNIESCVIAQDAGAHRIELCDGPGEGGTTASYGFIKEARKKLYISLYPIIRPRGGDFLYTDAEFEIMKDDIQMCKRLGCDGIVTGLLLKDGSIDKGRCSRLAELAYPMGVTFHRAFDRAANPEKALEDIIDCGFERILTSGQKPTAPEGANFLAKLVKKAEDRIIIMPGSGVRPGNIVDLAKATGAIEFHSSARKNMPSNMSFAVPSMNEDLQTVSVDPSEITEMIKCLSEIN